MIFVLIVQQMNQCFQPREEVTTYMNRSKQEIYTELVKIHTQLSMAVDQNRSMINSVIQSLTIESTRTNTAPPTPKGTNIM